MKILHNIMLLTLLLLSTTYLSAFSLNLTKDIVKRNGDRNLTTCNEGDIFIIPTTNIIRGQRFDLGIRIVAEENEADLLTGAGSLSNAFPKRPCIGLGKDPDGKIVIETILRDKNTTDGNDEAYMDIKFYIYKQGTSIELKLDELTFTAYDLDTTSGTSADVIFIPKGSEPIKVINSKVTRTKIPDDTYGFKLTGHERTCSDDDVKCRAAGKLIGEASTFQMRVSNENAFGTIITTDSGYEQYYRLIQIAPEDTVSPSLGIDHGDMPESYGDASHDIVDTLILGDVHADGETAQYSDNADADDLSAEDDEGAVKIFGASEDTLIMTQNHEVILDVQYKGTGYLSVWIDIDGNGSFDNDEIVIQDRNLSSDIVSNEAILFSLPKESKPGKSFMRVRLSRDINTSFSGNGGEGEVEDYAITIVPSGTVHGSVYNDKNGNGEKDAEEEGFAGINITVIAENGESQTTKTDAQGLYSFSGVAVGAAEVSIDEDDLPAGSQKTEGTTNPTTVSIVEAEDVLEEDNGYQIQANLETSKTADKSEAQAGDTVVYTLTVNNKGPGQATNVSLTEILPSQVSYVSDTGNGAYDPTSGLWSIGDLDNGANASLNITVTINAGILESIVNTITPATTPDQNDPTPEGDDTNETITIGSLPILTVADVSVEEGQMLAFNLTLSAKSNFDTKITLKTTDGTAKKPQDYNDPSVVEVTIPKGELSVEYAIPSNLDTISEIQVETFTLEATIHSGNTANETATAIGSIQDIGGDPIVSISGIKGANASAVENEEALIFEINISKVSSSDIEIELFTEDRTAFNGKDYESKTETLTIEAGQTGIRFPITLIDDKQQEDNETLAVKVKVTKGNVSNSQIEGIGTIIDDDNLPNVTIVGANGSDANVTEGGDLVFIITLSNPSNETIVIELNTTNGTAEEPEDYTRKTEKVVFEKGETMKRFIVKTIDDNLKEEDIERLTVNGQCITGSVSNSGTIEGTGIIKDNDGSPTLTIEGINGADAISEEGEGLVFKIVLSNPSDENITIDLTTKDGNASGSNALVGEDYTARTETIMIPAGSTSVEFVVQTIEDDILEDINETMHLEGNVISGTVSNPGVIVGIGTIIDDDGDGPHVKITGPDGNDANATEGEDLVFTITLSSATTEAITMELSTEDGTAIAGQDYNETNGTITINPGETTGSFTVHTIDDAVKEADTESMVLNAYVTQGTVANGGVIKGNGIIKDDDDLTSIIITGPNAGDAIVTEGEDLVFSITLSSPSNEKIAFNLSTKDGTAIAGSDYTDTDEIITFEIGETSKTFTVKTNDDNLKEDQNETLSLHGSIITGSVANPDAIESTGTIRDNDMFPTISITDINDQNVSVEEGNDLVFKITLSNKSNEDIIFDMRTEDITALASEDYNDTTQTLTIQAGTLSTTFTVPSIDDTRDENPNIETMKVILNVTAGEISNTSDVEAIGTIIDNDGAPIVSVAGIDGGDVSVFEGEDLIFKISLSSASSEDIVIELNTSDGTAKSPSDFESKQESVTIPAGSLSTTFTVTTVDDAILEKPKQETMTVNARITEGLVENQSSIITQGIIIDNDGDGPIVSITGIDANQTDSVAIEGNNLEFKINLDTPSTEDIVFSLSTKDGNTTGANAISPDDYTSISSLSVVLPAGETSVTFPVPTNDDIEDEETNEIMFVVAKVVGGTTRNDNIVGRGIIIDNDFVIVDDILEATQANTPVSKNVLENDGDGLDPTSVNLIAGSGTNAEALDVDGDGDIDKIVVPGEGTWMVDDTGTVTFTPESGFTGNPTPIEYNVKDSQGNPSSNATITATYPIDEPDAVDDNIDVEIGTIATIDILENDIDVQNDINRSSVTLIADPEVNASSTDTDGDGDIDTILVPGEGTWNVDDEGTLTFTPVPGFVGTPTAISYTVNDNTGATSNEATVTVRVFVGQELNDDEGKVVPGVDLEINLLANDGSEVSPETVSLGGLTNAIATDEDGDGDIDKLVLDNVGTWTVDNEGILTFVLEKLDLEDIPTITYTARDSRDTELTKANIVIVVDRPDPMELEAIDDIFTVSYNRPHANSVKDNDIVENIRNLEFHMIDPQSGAELSFNEVLILEDGNVTMDKDGITIFTPFDNALGQNIFEYVIRGNDGNLTSIAKVTVNVDCASTQRSDSVGMGIMSMLFMLFSMAAIGYYSRKEEEV